MYASVASVWASATPYVQCIHVVIVQIIYQYFKIWVFLAPRNTGTCRYYLHIFVICWVWKIPWIAQVAHCFTWVCTIFKVSLLYSILKWSLLHLGLHCIWMVELRQTARRYHYRLLKGSHRRQAGLIQFSTPFLLKLYIKLIENDFKTVHNNQV